MEYLTLVEVEFVAHELAQQMMSGDEPIPPFTSRYSDRLESCLSTPQQTYDKRELYSTLLDKASILFYLMIKSHPFKNGNKRVAIMTLIYFLYKNKKWLQMPDMVLCQFAKNVAAGEARKKDDEVASVKAFLKPHIVDYRPIKVNTR
ncbi:MAG: type II toxin-antitoxin system death-on-curing family toxin [Candidatus Uhrbacteria bacterium]|nr:type II toxin-antitoxin system death-on-curing family toxin [Candidatus Uhrbacteria bacterium]